MSIRLTCGGSQVRVLYRPPKKTASTFVGAVFFLASLARTCDPLGRRPVEPSEAKADICCGCKRAAQAAASSSPVSSASPRISYSSHRDKSQCSPIPSRLLPRPNPLRWALVVIGKPPLVSQGTEGITRILLYQSLRFRCAQPPPFTQGRQLPGFCHSEQREES